jgi:peptidoglycan/LPS O-acetylase OafA/YrhL
MPHNSLNNLSLTSQKFEYNLEGLRGFAALVVVFHHAIVHPFSLDPAYALTRPWVNPLPGHVSVLLFFILSGYVIGLTNKKPIILSTIIPYLRKRLVRLYPTYALSLIFTLLIVKAYPPITTTIGNFLFLQVAAVPYIWENNPLWSLNIEVLYYLLFIPISYFKISPKWACIASLIAGATCALFFSLPLLSTYCLGFVFWTSGLWLAQSRLSLKQYASNWSLIALLFLLLGYSYLNPFVYILDILDSKFGIHFKHSDINTIDLFQLPFCFYLIFRFTNHTITKHKLLISCFIVPNYLYYFYMAFNNGFNRAFVVSIIMPITFFTIGTALLIISYFKPRPKTESLLPKFLLKVGAISYGIYVIHFPISSALTRITFFSGSAFTFFTRLLIDIVLVLIAGYILEIKIQPWFKAWFSKDTPRLSASSN